MGNKGVKIRTDGPPFSNVLCAVLLQLDQMRDSAITEEHELINSRKKLEKDLAKYGSKKTPDRTAVAEAYTNVLLALKDCRSQMRFLSDQVSKGLKFGQQPALRQSEDEEKILALVGNKGEIEERLALWQAAKEESTTVGSQVEVGSGRVGEPGDTTTPPAAAPPGAPIPLDTAVRVLHVATNELKAEGTLESETTELWYVRVGSKRKEFARDIYRLEAAAAAATAPKLERGSTVRVLIKATGELEGTGKLDAMHDAYALVTIDGRQRRFAFDAYAVEASPAEPVQEVSKKKGGKKSAAA
jgi:hypothetical protein